MSTENNTAFENFLIPEKELSLKLVFDNVRNYVIIGAFGALARWFAMGNVTPVPGIIRKAPSGYGLQLLMWSTVALVIILFLLNLAQTYRMMMMALKSLRSLVAANAESQTTARWYHLVAEILAIVASVAAFMVTLIVVNMVAVYIVWFTANGPR